MGKLPFFGVHGKFWGLKLFSHNHFAEKYLKYAQMNNDSTPLCPVDSNFEGIKAKSAQKMQFCYVHREGG